MRALHALMVVGMSSLLSQCSLKVTSRVPSLSISIVEDSATWRDSKFEFHVAVSNVSNEQQRICLGGSWGDQALTSIFTDQAGKKWVAYMTPQAYTANILSYRELHPREKKVLNVCIDDVNHWEGFPHPKNEPVTVTMQARLDYEHYAQDKGFLRRGIWAGSVVSKPKKFTFYP